eukprot:UN13321
MISTEISLESEKSIKNVSRSTTFIFAFFFLQQNCKGNMTKRIPRLLNNIRFRRGTTWSFKPASQGCNIHWKRTILTSKKF